VSAVVFLGPTLSRADAQAVLDADYRPPVQMGDVLRTLELGRPDAIAIVDGRFDSVPSVWHKEILLALEEGVPVLGASSMGALRAAELHSFGMVGVGHVFELYRDGLIDADDEVAVAHGSAEVDFTPMSDALVDIRDDCEQAVECGAISASVAAELIRVAKALFYPDRTWAEVLRRARAAGIEPAALGAMAEFVAGRGLGRKARDAIELLEKLARGDVAAPAHPVPVAGTSYLERLQHEVRLAIAAGRRQPPSSSAVLPSGATLGEAREQVMLRVSARRAAAALGVVTPEEYLDAARQEFKEQHGLSGEDQLTTWLQQRSATRHMLDAYIADRALLRFLGEHLEIEILRVLPDHVRLMPDTRPPLRRVAALVPDDTGT